MGSTGLFGTTLALSGISLLTGNSILLERIMIGNQIFKGLKSIYNESSMGLNNIIEHYQLYGL